MPERLKFVVILVCVVLLGTIVVVLGGLFATGTEINNLPLAIGLFSAAYLTLPIFLYLLFIDDGPFWLTYLKMLGWTTALVVFGALLLVLPSLLFGI